MEKRESLAALLSGSDLITPEEVTCLLYTSDAADE